MADYFLSDVHLRHDFPDRAARLARVVDRLGPDDSLTIVGDLCDFWFAARQRHLYPLQCKGLRSLSDFTRRGGRLVVLAGNHDRWLGDFYQKALNAAWVEDAREVRSNGLRVYLTHGHRLNMRSSWKSGMETFAFLNAFGALPEQVAHWLETRLERSNLSHLAADDRKHLTLFRSRADDLAADADLILFGHVHQRIDEIRGSARLIVLGSWHEHASYLRINDRAAEVFIETDRDLLSEDVSYRGRDAAQ